MLQSLKTKSKAIWRKLRKKYHEARAPHRARLRNLKHQIIKKAKNLLLYTIPLAYNAVIIALAIKYLG